MTVQRRALSAAENSRPTLSERGRLIGTLSLMAFVALTMVVMSKVAIPFDAPILAMAQTYAAWGQLWDAVSQTANLPLIAIAIIYVVWLIREKRHREALLVIVVLAAVTAGSEGVKQLTARPRPSGSGAGIPGVVFSYPSGHVLEVMTILGLLVVRLWRSSHRLRVRLVFAVLVALEVAVVGYARMALNAHYPSDLLAGFFGAMGALGWYAWLTRAGGWADKPVAKVPDRTAAPKAGIRLAGPHPKGAAA